MHVASARSLSPEPQPAPANGAAPVSVSLSPKVLLTVLQPTTGLALWHRSARVGMQPAIEAALALAPFCATAEGAPDRAARELVREMPTAMRPLAEDLTLLGRLFATVTSDHTIRFRLEHVADDSCRQHHVDSVGLRLLCTYAGLGTEWIHPAGQLCRMQVFHVGVFKGSTFPDAAPRILHRSPPVEHLPKRRRSRLLLCIDQPGVF